MRFIKFVTLFFLSFCLFIPSLRAAEIVPDTHVTMKAKVLEVVSSETKDVPGTDVPGNYQTVKVQILDGAEKGKVVTVENDYINLKKGEVFYLVHTVSVLDSIDTYNVSEPYRLPAVFFFISLFVLCVVFFGGKQGVRGLISLVASFFFIALFLLPGIAHGYSPIGVSIGVSSLIIILGSYITHGFNKTTTSAVIGMIATIMFTGFLAYFSIQLTRLTGFTNEEAVYLNIDTRGSINFQGLLLGGILIGLLGVLYDAAIGQAVSVDELHRVAPHLPRSVIYKRAIRIGREHIGALVNTLAIAYVGVSLPLLLLYSTSSEGFMVTLNREIFSTEIIRTMIGSIGLVLAVPITTVIATYLLVKHRSKAGQAKEILEQEKRAIEHVGHSH